MGRTANSVSTVAISLEDLLEIIGPDFKGKISVGARWLKTISNPEEWELRRVGEEGVASLLEGIDIGVKKHHGGTAPKSIEI